MQQKSVLIAHISIECGVHPHPFAKFAAPHHIYNMAVVVGAVHLRFACEEARRPPHCHVHLAEHDGESAAVESALLLLARLIQCYRVARHLRNAAAPVVPYVVVEPQHYALHLRYFVAIACDAVQTEVLAHTHQIAVGGQCVGEMPPRGVAARGVGG